MGVDLYVDTVNLVCQHLQVSDTQCHPECTCIDSFLPLK